MSNNNQEWDNVLGKINEMRDFLKIGDEIIPFLEELFEFIKEVMPLMAEVNASFQDTSEKLPDAKGRINDVTEATEMATHEILDTLDDISDKVTEIKEDYEGENQENFKDIQNNITEITMALQFQDITEQKLSHANKILNAINKKFKNLSKNTKELQVSTTVGKKIVDEISSGIDVEERKEEKEKFDKETENNVRHDERISQDEVDELFD